MTSGNKLRLGTPDKFAWLRSIESSDPEVDFREIASLIYGEGPPICLGTASQ